MRNNATAQSGSFGIDVVRKFWTLKALPYFMSGSDRSFIHAVCRGVGCRLRTPPRHHCTRDRFHYATFIWASLKTRFKRYEWSQAKKFQWQQRTFSWLAKKIIINMTNIYTSERSFPSFIRRNFRCFQYTIYFLPVLFSRSVTLRKMLSRVHSARLTFFFILFL